MSTFKLDRRLVMYLELTESLSPSIRRWLWVKPIIRIWSNPILCLSSLETLVMANADEDVKLQQSKVNWKYWDSIQQQKELNKRVDQQRRKLHVSHAERDEAESKYRTLWGSGLVSGTSSGYHESLNKYCMGLVSCLSWSCRGKNEVLIYTKVSWIFHTVTFF